LGKLLVDAKKGTGIVTRVDARNGIMGNVNFICIEGKEIKRR